MNKHGLSEKLNMIPSGLFFLLRTASELEAFVMGMYVSDKIYFNHTEAYVAYSTLDKFVQRRIGIEITSWGKAIEGIADDSLTVAKRFIVEHESLNVNSGDFGNYFDEANRFLKNTTSFKTVMKVVRDNLHIFKILNCDSLRSFYSGHLYSLTSTKQTEDGAIELFFNIKDKTFVNFYLPEFTNFLIEQNQVSPGGRRFIDIVAYLGFNQVESVVSILYDNYIDFLEFKKIQIR